MASVLSIANCMLYLIVKFTFKLHMFTKYIALFKVFFFKDFIHILKVEEQNTNIQSQNCNLLLIIN